MTETQRRIPVSRRALRRSLLAASIAIGALSTPVAGGARAHHTVPAIATANNGRLLAACPIEDPAERDLHDSWGWARSGGRRHQGIDVAAPRGTELYAVRGGEVEFKRSRLGGNSVWLRTDDGDRFFYAHLDGFEGESRRVQAGELIGYVGSTGNAGGPHLHFETHPAGNVENPFDHVVDACTAETVDGVSPIELPSGRLLRAGLGHDHGAHHRAVPGASVAFR